MGLMRATQRRAMTIDEFLRWEEAEELRWEFDGFEPVATVGGTVGHAIIQRNVITALTNRLRGGPCQAFASDLKIRTPHAVRYPDAFVSCTPVARGATVVTEPVVVFEVLSPGTATTDHLVKNQEYRDTGAIQRYVILAQDRPGGMVFSRTGGEWVGRVLDADSVLAMPEIGISIPMAEFYEGLAFGDEAVGG